MAYDRFSRDRIERLYSHYGTDRIEMYRNLGDQEAKRAQDLSSQGHYTKAVSAADQAREYREAALMLTDKILGTGI